MFAPVSSDSTERQAIEKLYFLFFMRPMQFFGVALVVAGIGNIRHLVASAAQAVAGNVDLPALCGKLVAVTGPCIVGGQAPTPKSMKMF